MPTLKIKMPMSELTSLCPSKDAYPIILRASKREGLIRRSDEMLMRCMTSSHDPTVRQSVSPTQLQIKSKRLCNTYRWTLLTFASIVTKKEK